MPKLKVRCPECRARLVVPAGVEEAECPKCESTFLLSDAGAGAPGGPAPRRPAYPRLLLAGIGLLAAGVTALAALVLTGTISLKFADRPRAPVAPPGEPAKAPAVPETAPAADDPDPFRPADPAALAAVGQLDKLAAIGPAIPQNEVRLKAVREARLDWSRNNLERAFDRAGRADAPWAGKARAALALRAKELAASHPGALTAPENAASRAALAAAVADGCDDPLVLYYHALPQITAAALFDQALADTRRVVRPLWESKYPDARKAYAVQNLLGRLRDARGAADEVATWEERFRILLTRVCADPDAVTQEHVLTLVQRHEEHAVLSGRTREEGHAEAAECLTQGGAPESTRLAARGAFLIRFAWDARGYGFANTVTREGGRKFAERLAEAEDALTAAHDADQDRAHAATSMLTVCMGRGHPREEMEKWFDRALRADPDNARACHVKVEYLHPKWHGSDPEYLGFAWQCVRTRNTVGMLPFAAVANLTANAPIPERVTPAVLTQLQPLYASDGFWRVLDTGLTVLHRDRPELLWARGTHARAACVAGRHGVAMREFNAINNDWQGAGFRSPVELGFFRLWAGRAQLPQ